MTRSTPPTIATALIVTASGVACSGAQADRDVGSREQPVIGGRVEDSFPAAGYLVRGGVASCSAVLVERDLALTAGHCVDGHHDISFGWGRVGEHPPVRSIASAIHPRYIHPPKNGGVAFQGFDVAVVRLEGAAGVPPARPGVTPELGAVRAVGYGATAYVEGDGGTFEPHGVGTERRSIEGSIRGRSASEVFVRFDPGTSACYGDSGGPLFTEGGELVAVLSRFTEIGRCLPRDRSLMGFVRLDTMGDFFRHAHECLPDEDVQGCLREEARRLCAAPRFHNRRAPFAVRVPDDPRGASSGLELGEGEERTLTVTPAYDVVVTLDTAGDARMRVAGTGGRPSTRVALVAGQATELVVGSCNGERQSVTLWWQRAGEATATR